MAYDPFSTTKPKKTKTTYSTSNTTSGSAEGQADGKWGTNEYKNRINSGAPTYDGPNPYATERNEWQLRQGDTLGGLQDSYKGEGGWQDKYNAIGGMSPDEVAAMNRRGGPAAGYIDPYQDQMISGMEDDMRRANIMGADQVGAGADGVNAFGGTRHGAAEGVMTSENARNFLSGARGVRSDSFKNAMNWQREDYKDEMDRVRLKNADTSMFNKNTMTAGQFDFDNQIGLSNAQGAYGNYQDQKEIEGKNWLKSNWDQRENRNDNYLTGYTNSVSGTPYETNTVTDNTSLQTGQGKSNFDNTLGYVATGASIKMYFMCIPEGTAIDTTNGPVLIEDIKSGDIVVGYSGKETEVLQAHQYKEDPVPTRFAAVTFDNGAKVNCCDMHRINGRHTKDYKIGDKVGSRTITNIKWYNGVNRSHDLLTLDGGYQINSVPVNSMIEEMAGYVNQYKQAA
jgi:hypothetical protein